MFLKFNSNKSSENQCSISKLQTKLHVKYRK